MKPKQYWEYSEEGWLRPKRGTIYFIRDDYGNTEYQDRFPTGEKLPVDTWVEMKQNAGRVAVEVRDIVTGLASPQRMSCIIRYKQCYSFPADLSRHLNVFSLLAQQAGMWTLEPHSLTQKREREAEERYESQAKELVGIKPEVRVSQGRVTIDVHGFKWMGMEEDHVKFLHFLRNFDEKGRIPEGQLAYKVQEMATGDVVLVAPHRGEGLHESKEVESWRYQETQDDAILKELRVLKERYDFHPDKMSSDTYLHRMDQYEYAVRRSHNYIVQDLATRIQRPVVAVGDGIGRFASLWPWGCQSYDQVITQWTHPRVKKATITEILETHPPQILMLMYVWYSLTDHDKALLFEREKKGLVTVVIDTRPNINFGKKVNNMVYVSGMELVLPYYNHDSPEKVYGINFSDELLSLGNPKFAENSNYGQYYRFMKPFFKPLGEEVEVVDTVQDLLQNRGAYFSRVGRSSVPVLQFHPGARHTTRTVYWLPKDHYHIVPSTLHKERIGDRVYFYSSEVRKTKHYFKGSTLTKQYHYEEEFFDLKGNFDLSSALKAGVSYSKSDLTDLAKSWNVQFKDLLLHVTSRGEDQYYKKNEILDGLYQEEVWDYG